MERLTTSALAKQGGVDRETVRYYERRGLLPKPPRLPSGYRAFSPDSVQRLRFIKRAQGLGFSLREIKELLALRVKPGASCAAVQQQAAAKLDAIAAKIRALRAMEQVLRRFTAACSGRGPISECPILHALDDERLNVPQERR